MCARAEVRRSSAIRAHGKWWCRAAFATFFMLAGMGNASATGDHQPSWFISPDTAPPEFTLHTPEPDTATADNLPVIELTARDPIIFLSWLSLLDESSVAFAVNGTDVTDNVVVERSWVAALAWWLPVREVRIRYTPPQPLPDGTVEFSVSMADRAGNVGTFSGKFGIDTAGPTVQALQPPVGGTISDVQMPITYDVSDVGTAVDTATLSVAVNDAARTDGIVWNDSQLTIAAPEGGWPVGPLNVRIELADVLGNRTTADFPYVVATRVELAAYPRAVPTSGDAPLAVTFTPTATTTTAIERYEWDFDGNGTYDRSETVGRNQSYTYATPGTYDAVLRVTDTSGEQATGTVRITVGNQPPSVAAEAVPSNGAPPLGVTFTATATDSNGIALYEWDFDGDGTYDLSGTSNVASFTYTDAGVFRPRLRVVDGLGAATELTVPTIEVRVVVGAPTVAATATPATGNTPLVVNFDASASDPDGHTIVEWAWDFDGDGTYDYVSPTAAATSHTYTAPGTFYARVRATAADGGTAVDAVMVQANLSLALQVSTDTIDASLGETSTVQTTLGGDTEVSLVIENRNGSPVRTLVPWELRLAGTYSDSWDGADDQGATVPEGEYRAILLYRIDGEERRLDLGLTTGGVQSNPPRSGIPSRFSPLAGEPLRITYTLNRASEVTAFMGRYNVNTRLITFMQRAPKGRGTHTIVWNGENSDGVLIHPPAGDSFLFGIFAYTLPNNAIYVRSGVHASGLAVSPAILDPTGLADDGLPATGTVRFDLNRAGAVELTVFNADTGAEMLRRTIGGLDGGEQEVTWDGRDGTGTLVAPGRYRIGVAGLDQHGSRSTAVFALQRIYY